jgi:hypothetical protein
VLELRMQGLRQRLPAAWSGCSAGTVRPATDYLLWAGDLDRDGKPDLIISRDGVNDVTLYLSSSAAKGEAVGEAGRFAFSDPGKGEC